MYKIQGLQENEKLDIITGYMDLYGKTLNKEQTDLIINAKQSSNPLYLKALLDEVCFSFPPSLSCYRFRTCMLAEIVGL